MKLNNSPIQDRINSLSLIETSKSRDLMRNSLSNFYDPKNCLTIVTEVLDLLKMDQSNSDSRLKLEKQRTHKIYT